jgi:hypothetical protein
VVIFTCILVWGSCRREAVAQSRNDVELCFMDYVGIGRETSKVCELGFFNYKAKQVFHPVDGKKFRCHGDYYWASVFKVEYVDHSGQQKLAQLHWQKLPMRPSHQIVDQTAWLQFKTFLRLLAARRVLARSRTLCLVRKRRGGGK